MVALYFAGAGAKGSYPTSTNAKPERSNSRYPDSMQVQEDDSPRNQRHSILRSTLFRSQATFRAIPLENNIRARRRDIISHSRGRFVPRDHMHGQ